MKIDKDMVRERRAVSVGVSLDLDLLAKIDSERGDITRSRWLLRLIQEAYAEREKQKK